jgi:hypothetical protein
MKMESNLLYEMIWIGQARADRILLSQSRRFDKKFAFVKPMAHSVSFRLAVSQCTYDYIIIFEDDWLAVNMSLPWFSFSMDLLAHAPESMYAILLGMAPLHGPIFKTTIQSCLVSQGTVWRFGPETLRFTSRPTMYRMSSVNQILANHDYAKICGFAGRAKVLGYTFAFWADGIAPPDQIPIRFRHVGA